MKAIVLLLALASATFADAYTPVDWLEVTEDPEVGLHSTEDGGYKVRVGSYALTGDSGCFAGGFTINDARYSIRTTKWQMGFRMERRVGNRAHQRRSLRPDLGHATATG